MSISPFVTTVFLLLALQPLHAFYQLDKRPFRTFFKLDPQLDRIKPLGVANYAGWVKKDELLIGTLEDSQLVAYSLDKKSFAWSYPVQTSVTSPIALFDSFVLLTTRDGYLHKLERKTGKLMWSKPLSSFAIRAFKKFQNVLVVVTAHQKVYAIDFQTGAILWLYDAGHPEQMYVHMSSAPAIFKKQIYLGLNNGELLALSLEKGELIKRINPFIGDSPSRFLDYVGEMTVVDGQLLVTRYDGFVASLGLDRDDFFQVQWKRNIGSATAAHFRDGKLFVSTNGGKIYAISAARGEDLWSKVLGVAVQSVVAGENKLYIAGSQGYVFSLNSQTGETHWHDYLGADILSKPFFGDKSTIYFVTSYNNFYGYRQNL